MSAKEPPCLGRGGREGEGGATLREKVEREQETMIRW